MLSESTTIAASTNYVPFIESRPQSSPEELRARMDEYGYLFFRGLAPAEEVLTVRRDVLEVLQEAGWLDPRRELMEGIASPDKEPTTEGKPDYLPVYRKVLALPRFHNFPCLPALMGVMQHFLEGEVLVHPRRIGRITFPGSVAWTTPAHQDFYYIRGAVETYSCWTPLGECPIELGGLAILPGSHKQGFLEHSARFPGAVGGHGLPIDESKVVWHTGDFGLGDALFFRSYTIHKALPNLTKDRLRLSTDNRYQRKEDDIDPGALRPHFG